MSTITIRGNLPRPVSGDGDVVIALTDNDLVLSWEKGSLKDARLASDEETLDEFGGTDATTCECCVWVNGVEHCKPITCGKRCP